MDATQEQWRPIKGREGTYEVSDQGRVRSLPRTVVASHGVARRLKGKVLRPFKGDAYDHQLISLGARDRHYVHTIVLETFVGPRPPGYEACHNDGDPFNNRLENLRWDTPSANQRDRDAHGTHHYGSRTHCKWGHEFTPANTSWRIRTGPRYVRPSKVRVCLACKRKSYAANRKGQ